MLSDPKKEAYQLEQSISEAKNLASSKKVEENIAAREAEKFLVSIENEIQAFNSGSLVENFEINDNANESTLTALQPSSSEINVAFFNRSSVISGKNSSSAYAEEYSNKLVSKL